MRVLIVSFLAFFTTILLASCTNNTAQEHEDSGPVEEHAIQKVKDPSEAMEVYKELEDGKAKKNGKAHKVKIKTNGSEKEYEVE